MIERAIVVGNGKKITLKDLPIGSEAVASSFEALMTLKRIIYRIFLLNTTGIYQRQRRLLKLTGLRCITRLRSTA